MEKITIHYRSGVKRLLAFLLCAVCVFGMIPTQAFAFSPGQKASSWLGDQYVGSDGIIMRRHLTPTLFTILMERWMCAAVPGATLTGIIC